VIRITTFLLGTVNFNRLGGKLVYGGEGDLIAEPTKGSRQHLGALFLFSGTQELGVLRGVMKREKLWHSFSDEIKPLPVHTQIGRAMTLDEKTRLAKAAGMHPKWQNARWAMVLALNTTMRASEIKALRWRDVDFLASTITIRKSETEAGQRVIPLNDDALSIMNSTNWAKLCVTSVRASRMPIGKRRLADQMQLNSCCRQRRDACRNCFL